MIAGTITNILEVAENGDNYYLVTVLREEVGLAPIFDFWGDIAGYEDSDGTETFRIEWIDIEPYMTKWIQDRALGGAI